MCLCAIYANFLLFVSWAYLSYRTRVVPILTRQSLSYYKGLRAWFDGVGFCSETPVPCGACLCLNLRWSWWAQQAWDNLIFLQTWKSFLSYFSFAPTATSCWSFFRLSGYNAVIDKCFRWILDRISSEKGKNHFDHKATQTMGGYFDNRPVKGWRASRDFPPNSTESVKEMKDLQKRGMTPKTYLNKNQRQ